MALNTTTTLTATPSPAMVASGSTLFAATVDQNNNPVTAGNIVFLLDGAVVATIPVDGTGTATFQVTPTFGPHTIEAKYPAAPGFNASTSGPQPLYIFQGLGSGHIILNPNQVIQVVPPRIGRTALMVWALPSAQIGVDSVQAVSNPYLLYNGTDPMVLSLVGYEGPLYATPVRPAFFNLSTQQTSHVFFSESFR